MNFGLEQFGEKSQDAPIFLVLQPSFEHQDGKHIKKLHVMVANLKNKYRTA